jgi:hypothetical protein
MPIINMKNNIFNTRQENARKSSDFTIQYENMANMKYDTSPQAAYNKSPKNELKKSNNVLRSIEYDGTDLDERIHQLSPIMENKDLILPPILTSTIEVGGTTKNSLCHQKILDMHISGENLVELPYFDNKFEESLSLK